MQHLQLLFTCSLQPRRAVKTGHRLSFSAGQAYYKKKAHLWLLTCGLDYPFQYHHNFKLLRLHGPLGQFVEGAFGVNHVADRER